MAARERHSTMNLRQVAQDSEQVVHLIDDDRQYRHAIALQLRSAGIDVECYPSAEVFLASYQPRAVECILLELRMPGMTGLELQCELAARHIYPPLIFVSAYVEPSNIVRAVQHGAIDFLQKPIEPDVLLARVKAGLDRDLRQKKHHGDVATRMLKLTEREREVLDLLVAAKTTTQVAHELAISPKTVEKHRVKIFRKLEVDSVPALIRLLLGPTPPDVHRYS